MIAIDVVKAFGHKNVKATHRTTMEITKDNYLTPRGDCIIGIKANKGAKDLSEELKKLIRQNNSFVYIVLKVNDKIDIIKGKGDSRLTLENENKIIVRKSDFVSDATIAIKADKSARNIDREIIRDLQNEKTELTAFIIASDSPLEDTQILRILINLNPISFS